MRNAQTPRKGVRDFSPVVANVAWPSLDHLDGADVGWQRPLPRYARMVKVSFVTWGGDHVKMAGHRKHRTQQGSGSGQQPRSRSCIGAEHVQSTTACTRTDPSGHITDHSARRGRLSTSCWLIRAFCFRSFFFFFRWRARQERDSSPPSHPWVGLRSQSLHSRHTEPSDCENFHNGIRFGRPLRVS